MDRTFFKLLLIFALIFGTSSGAKDARFPEMEPLLIKKSIKEFTAAKNYGALVDSLEKKSSREEVEFLKSKTLKIKDKKLPELRLKGSREVIFEFASGALTLEVVSLKEHIYKINHQTLSLPPQESPQERWDKIVKTLPKKSAWWNWFLPSAYAAVDPFELPVSIEAYLANLSQDQLSYVLEQSQFHCLELRVALANSTLAQATVRLRQAQRSGNPAEIERATAIEASAARKQTEVVTGYSDAWLDHAANMYAIGGINERTHAALPSETPPRLGPDQGQEYLRRELADLRMISTRTTRAFAVVPQRQLKACLPKLEEEINAAFPPSQPVTPTPPGAR